ncbi:OLC1v1012198C1 [Oldenlandia corymbosa var. corymbosa]|uniref:OLC1v1012198C1 n=1 Tax=Oldenlandia corymbosa var. corymbosa TaxID=529605 RepID=A0AAV1DYK7_OLDCO|nr:OLC1v1012198C1 [Oldenlandia corymbosa var. corymbosa]
MILAVHLSLWHPDDVNLQWDIMHNKRNSVFHVPSLILGVGIAAGCGALLVFAAQNRSHAVVSKTGRLPRFKMK